MNKRIINSCSYCNRPAVKQFKNGKFCCQKYYVLCPAIKEKNSEGKRKTMSVECGWDAPKPKRKHGKYPRGFNKNDVPISYQYAKPIE